MQTIVCGRWNRRSSTRQEAQSLWRVRNKLERNDARVSDLGEAENALNSLTVRRIKELEAAGVSMLGDGGFRWDSVYDVARGLKGCGCFERLTRIPEVNHFHRQAIADLLVEHVEPILLDDLRFARANTELPIVVSPPGPYSLARQTQNVAEFGIEGLSIIYAKALNKEIKILLENGAVIVRVEDPQILSHPEDFELFRALSYELLLDVDASRVALATWFGDIDVSREYFNLPFGIFFVDFVEGDWNNETLTEAFKEFPAGKKLVAGILDARQTYEEQERDLLAIMGNILKFVDRSRVLISTNTDLHFLPWDEALAKVKKMVEFAQACEARQEIPLAPFVSLGRRLKEIRENQHPLPKTQIIPRRPFSIPFPTSAVGSYPQHQAIRTARLELRGGKISEEEYRRIVEAHTKRWMEFQIKELDMTCPVGGEFLREDMAAYFGERIGGRKLDFVPSYENRCYRPIEYFEPISPAKHPMTTDDFRLLQSLSPDRPVKETITGPVTMADWGLIKHPQYYFDRMAYRMGFVKAIRTEIEKMIKAGVKILQIDEPALTTKPKDFALDARALYEVACGFDKELYLILHICYSDLGALDKAFPEILKLPFHQIHMEIANRGDAMFGLIGKHGFGGKDIGLGVVDVHTNRIETVEEVVESVRKARRYFAPEQIWITPDCGFKERSDEVAMAKLRVMCEAARICRGTLV